MADLPKIGGKFDLNKIISDVKSMITPPPIPEASKDNPVGYYLSELNKLAKELAENNTKQADSIAKVNTMLGSLYQELAKSQPSGGGSKPTAPTPEKKASAPEPKKAIEGGKETAPSAEKKAGEAESEK